MSLKPGRTMKLLDPKVAGAILTHPAHQASPPRIAELIGWLRACEQPGDFYQFQQHLFGDIYKAEERRAQCSRIIKRLKRGERLPSEMPPLPPAGDPTQLGSWELEAYVHERIARQLRTVGDGLAWRCFGFDRRIILTLSRNASPGPMYGKEGLPYELGRVQDLWKESGHFALLHDLTNCLRIADLTEFISDGGALLWEVKRTPHTERRQIERIQTAIDAIMHGGEMPGVRPDARLVEFTEPYATNLRQLNDLIQLAKRHGNRAMKLSQGRALVATSLPATHLRWGVDHEAAGRALYSVRQRAFRRAGIAGAVHHVRGVSADTAARSPIAAPWSIYPFSPVDCTAIICDLLVFETTISVDALATYLRDAGMDADIFLVPSNDELEGDKEVLRLRLHGRALTLHAQGLNTLLYELLEPRTWVSGMHEFLANTDPPAEPVIVFAHEEEMWL